MIELAVSSKKLTLGGVMNELTSLFETPESKLTRKYRKEIDNCEDRVKEASSTEAPGLVHAYRRSIELRKEYLSDSRKTLKELLQVD
jgi:hypothetical protein